jgi:hypothetical protein
LEKTPLPREVVLTEGMDHHLLFPRWNLLSCF